RRVGGGDAGEVAEAAGGVLQHLAVEMAAEIVGGADDGVGDQVRQVRGDGEDAVVVRRVHPVHVAAEGPPERLELVGRGGIDAGQRRQDAPATLEQVEDRR